MLAKDIMTRDPRCATTDDTAETAARMMRDQDCGSIPVVDQASKVVGVVTDRDLAIRGMAEGLGGDAPVAKLMTLFPYCAKVDDELAAVEKTMAERQVRRVPVVDDENRIVGIIAQADLARAAMINAVSEKEVALVVERISGSRPAIERQAPRKSVDLLADTLIVEPTSNER